MMRRLLATLGVTVLAFTLVLRAADPVPMSPPRTGELTPEQIEALQKETAFKQAQMKKDFEEFRTAILTLAQRLEASPRQEDKDKARLLREAIELANQQGVETKFQTLLGLLKKDNALKQTSVLEDLFNKNEDLRSDLLALIKLLQSDDPDSRLREERQRLERMLERLREVIAKQERVRAQTEIGRKDATDLKKEQDKVTAETKNLIGKEAGKNGEDKGATKAEGKPGEAKQGSAAEGKEDAKDLKGEKKEAPGAGTPSENKDPAQGEGKQGGQQGEGQEGETKQGQQGGTPENKPAEGKQGQQGEQGGEQGQGQQSEGKQGGEQGQGQQGEGKQGGEQGQGQQGENKQGGPQGGQDQKSENKQGGQGQGQQGEGKQGGEGQQGENKQGGQQGQGQQSEGKQGGEQGEGKPGGEPGGQGENKPGGGQQGEGKQGGEQGMGQGQQGQAGEGKPGGQGQQSEGKQGGQPGMGQGQQGQPGGQGKEGGQQGGMGGQKSGEAKQGGEQGMGGQKGGEAKQGGQQGQGQQKGKEEGKGENKPGQQGGMGGMGGMGEGKPSEGKPSQGQGGQGGQSQGKGQGGEGGQGGGGKPPPGQQPQSQEEQEARKRIEDSNKYQESAGKKIEGKDNPGAGGDQDEAIKELQKAQAELEKLLKQKRQEEIERLLAKLQGRCEFMLALQRRVRDETVKVNDDTKDQKLTEAQQREKETKSNDLMIKEEEIIKEANMAIRLIEAEGSAIAFAEVFKQVRGDMTNVAQRFRRTDVGDITIAIENDIIATLEEMVEALKQARKENQQPPPPPKPGQPQQQKPQDQKLLDAIAELKLIRSMQKRVNDRTELYAKKYSGEQAPVPAEAKDPKSREDAEAVLKEMQGLATSQQTIGKITRDIALGRNKSN